MKIENVLSAKGLAFVMLFSLVVLAANQLNFSPILGGATNQSFTFFQFLGPIAGGFLGAGVGAVSVLLAEVISFIWLGNSINLLNIALLAPMLFATAYFAAYARGKFAGAAVSLVCMAAFIAHPVGQQAWIYSLYWLIPAIAIALPEHLFLRSLGSTFTAHSVGSVVWLYAFPSTPAFWLALIPVYSGHPRGLADPPAHTFLRACSRSAIRSATSSRPRARRTRLSTMPMDSRYATG